MKEHPILFTAPMVRAILDGRKTMTRRVIREFPTTGYRWGGWILENGTKSDTGKATIVPEGNLPYMAQGQIKARCPYGQPGDRLWVRETFFETCDPCTSQRYTPPRFCYRATFDFENNAAPFVDDGDGYAVVNGDGTIKSPWRPSIHMPRKASRLLLEVTAVRVERLQDITEEDAKSEGADGEKYRGQGFDHCIYREAFRTLWGSINAKRGYSWESNPWVWVVSFTRIEP